MKFSTWLENNLDNIWYHGTPKKFTDFSYDFLASGRGYDREGPGFYFTSSPEDAKDYGGLKQ